MARNFPCTAQRRAMVALAAGSILLSFAANAPASADLKHKKHHVQHQITGAQSGLDESSTQLRDATQALQAAQVRLDAARSHLATTRGQLAAARALDQRMQAKLEAAEARLQRARADLDAGRRKIAGQEKTLRQLVVQNFQDGDPSLMGLSMVLTSQNPQDLTGELNSVKNVLDKQDAVLARLQASKVLLKVHAKEVHAAEVQVAAQRKAAAENLQRKQQLEAQAEAAAAQVRDLVGQRRQARQQAQQAKAHDEAVLRRLQQREQHISAILKRRAERARRRALARARRQHANAAPNLSSNGYLSYPVVAPITDGFGWRIHPIYGYRSFHDGVDFAANCGTPIHAAASGRVMQEYYQTAWGNRLILDNGYHRGVGLATIYNHMSGYTVGTGAYVHRGQVIGYVGTTGWSTGCHLHFTVLANGTAVNPMNWF